MIVMIKAPEARGWLVPGQSDGVTARFVQDTAQGRQERDDAVLRHALGLDADQPTPTQIEVEVNAKTYRKLAGQVFWR